MGGPLADKGDPVTDIEGTTADMGGPLAAGDPMTHTGGLLSEIGGP